jgi:hypothetical protein
MSEIISIIINIIISIIITYLMFIQLNTKMIFRGPNSNDIRNKIYKNLKTNKCYTLEPVVYECPNKI